MELLTVVSALVITLSSLATPSAFGKQVFHVGVLPPETRPVIPAGDDIILYIHGGPGSRLEEAADLVSPLLAAGLAKHKRYTVISFDQPSQGYSSMVDPLSIIPAQSDAAEAYSPLVAFSENFIVAFVDELDKITSIKNRNIYIIGGSTGGMLALRMGHRSEPWIKKVVAWNPASVWTTYAYDLLKGMVLHDGFARAGVDEWPDTTIGPYHVRSTRSQYFDWVFAQPTAVTQPNPEEWYRGNRGDYHNGGTQQPFRQEWLCKWDYIAATRLEQEEVYNPAGRRWHFRFGTELLHFSFFNDSWVGPARTAAYPVANDRPPNYWSIGKPTLLVASDDDDWNVGPNLHWENRWTQTRSMAQLMRNTPGYTLYLPNTGHSIHNERPILFADQIVTFLTSDLPNSGPLQVRPPYEESKMPNEDQNCVSPLSQFPPIPPQLLDVPEAATFLMQPARLHGNFKNGRTPGQYTLRLKPELRRVAQAKDPLTALSNAAARYYQGDTLRGNAFSDLAVTGRDVYEALRRHQPTDNEVVAKARTVLTETTGFLRVVATRKPDEPQLLNAVHRALNRAYRVAWALRNPTERAGYELRQTLGWIAVSGEDDPPARPVNVPSGIPIFAQDGKTQVSAYPQYELQITMCPAVTPPYVPDQCPPGVAHSVPFHVRYTVASTIR